MDYFCAGKCREFIDFCRQLCKCPIGSTCAFPLESNRNELRQSAQLEEEEAAQGQESRQQRLATNATCYANHKLVGVFFCYFNNGVMCLFINSWGIWIMIWTTILPRIYFDIIIVCNPCGKFMRSRFWLKIRSLEPDPTFSDDIYILRQNKIIISLTVSTEFLIQHSTRNFNRLTLTLGNIDEL